MGKYRDISKHIVISQHTAISDLFPQTSFFFTNALLSFISLLFEMWDWNI